LEARWHHPIGFVIDARTCALSLVSLSRAEGVWVGVIEEIAGRLKQLSREMAVILVEQHIELALELASHAYVMDRGHVALEGPAASVRSDPRLLHHLAP
jgi:branched-chain amino acid transport system ATP-binding protein